LDPIQIIILIMAIELALYLASNASPRVRDALSRIGLEPIPLGILIKRRSSGEALDRFRGSRSARVFFTLGIPVMAASMVIFYLFVYIVGIDFVARYIRASSYGGETPSPPLVPIIPGLTITGMDIVYLLIAIGVSVTLHELGHAIAAKAEHLRLKSYGAGLFLFMPLAFVELEEEEILRSRRLTAGRILSGGVLMNMVLFVIFAGAMILALMLAPLAGVSQGVIVDSIEKGSLADRSGISPGLLIQSINGTPIRSIEDFMRYRAYIASREPVYLDIRGIYPNGTRYSSIIYKPENITRLGIYLSLAPLGFGLSTGALVHVWGDGYSRLYWLEEILRIFLWISIVSISLAVINAAPLFITDGGKLLDTLLPRRLSKPLQIITTAGFILIFALSLANFIS